MSISALTALSPLDGRYCLQVSELAQLASEFGLIRFRLIIEIKWLIRLTQLPEFTGMPSLTASAQQSLENIIQQFTLKEAQEIKQLEYTTLHDVKAIEYYLQNVFKKNSSLSAFIPFIHFGCTSEDINNLAYGLMLLEIRTKILTPAMQAVIEQLSILAKNYAHLPMLTRTHGQPASPSTLGKELANFTIRLNHQIDTWQQLPILGKFNGAIGNFNAHLVAAPEIDWPALSQEFIKSLGLQPNAFTTQIEPHDNLAEILQNLMRFNTILIDLNRDLWGYISLEYFKQKRLDHQVGSSTMPHKINPIDFENSEGNLGVANALANHCAQKLPISRWQRDLSDSTVLRNLGCIFGYSLIAYQATIKGLNKLTVNTKAIEHDLNQHWEVLGEAVQTVLRRFGINDGYERLKSLTRGKTIDQNLLHDFIETLPIPNETKKNLQKLTPNEYIGYAVRLTQEALMQKNQ